jgi:hypothetical protein
MPQLNNTIVPARGPKAPPGFLAGILDLKAGPPRVSPDHGQAEIFEPHLHALWVSQEESGAALAQARPFDLRSSRVSWLA